MHIGARNTAEPPKLLVVLAFAAIYVLWGSTFLAIQYTVETLPPFLMAGARAFVAGVVLAAVTGVPRRHALTPAHWRTATITGGLFFLGCHGLLFRVERVTDSGTAALLLATIPGWMAVLSWSTGRAELNTRMCAGLVLGLAGVAALVLPAAPETRSSCSPISAGVLLLSAMSWACGSVYSRSAPLPEHVGAATAMQLLCGGALAILFGVLIGEAGQLDSPNVNMRSVFSLLYLIVFGSLVSFSAYIWLLRVVEPATVGTYAYVNPVVALLLGWLVGGESLDPRSAAAAAVIIASVVLVHHGQNRVGWARNAPERT